MEINMTDNEKMRLLGELDAAQTRFEDANTAGYELGIEGGRYADPFEAISDICRDKKDEMDRIIAYHYDRGYVTAYGIYREEHPKAAEDINYRRRLKKCLLFEKAQRMGSAAYVDGRGKDDSINEVYDLLQEVAYGDGLSAYDGWDFGYLLGLAYDGNNNRRKYDWPKFDYDRAYALVSVCKDVRNIAIKGGMDLGSCFAQLDEILTEVNDKNCPVPTEVARAFLYAWDIVEASEDDALLECIPCPFHYGCNGGLDCGRNCHESATAIWTMIGSEDDVFREWLVHR